MKKVNKLLAVGVLSLAMPLSMHCTVFATSQISKENVAPKIKILEEKSVGCEGVYSKLVLEATDEDGDLDYYLINGYAHSTIPEANGYKNSRTFIKGHIKDGENKIKVFDKAGNCSDEITFIADYTKPEMDQLRIIGGSYEKETMTYYARENDVINVYVGFKEELGTSPKVKINDNIELDMKYYEKQGFYGANFKIDETMTEGEIKVEVYGYADKAGNVGETLTNNDMTLTSQSKVIVDKTAPQCTGLRIIGSKYNKNNNAWYVKNGEYIQVYVKFDEDLKTAPVLKIEGIEKEIILNKSEKTGEYGVRMQITENDMIKDGEMKILISGYTDKAGNLGKILTNDDINGLLSQSKVIIDRTAPKITVKENTEKEIFTVKNKDGNTYSKISFKLYDAQKIEKIVINGKERVFTQNQYGDFNFVSIDKNYGVEGKNEITLYDISGNTVTYEFYLENEKEDKVPDEEIKKPEDDNKPSEGNHDKHTCKNICCYIRHKICMIEKIINNIFGIRLY